MYSICTEKQPIRLHHLYHWPRVSVPIVFCRLVLCVISTLFTVIKVTVWKGYTQSFSDKSHWNIPIATSTFYSINVVVFIIFCTSCCSNVGRQGGHQTLILGYGCYSHRIILHELGHLIGFWHEQGRPDRDDYVDILYGNISPGEIHQFGKKSASSVTSLGQVII